MTSLWYYQTPLGQMGIAEREGYVTHVFFGGMVGPKKAVMQETPVLARAAEEISEYLAGSRREFTVPWMPDGTPWQQRVWQGLCAIPYGQTCSYGALARALGALGASRAVGRANGANPIALLIPCHRVIGADGRLTGYAGGLGPKKALLALEQGESLVAALKIDE